MQMGIVDPTAGTLAGMFIDRMRSAQTQEQAPQQTVAQQVFAPPAPPAPPQGGLPPAPPMGGAPMGAPAGLGATPEAAQMAPMPEMPQQEAPMGMAGGGLTTLPLPDTMFDEPDNGGYADGGIVAFAGGGDTNPLGWMYSDVTSAYGKRAAGMHQGLDFGVGNNTPIGAPAPGKVIKVAKDDINGNFVVVRHPDGTTSSYSHLSKPAVQEGQEVGPSDVLGLSGNTGRVRGANGGYHLHFGARDAEGNRINPEDFLRSIGPQTASGKWQQKIPERDTSTAQGRGMSFEDSQAAGRNLVSGFPREEMERAREYALEQLDPEVQKQAAKADMWEGLAAMGFRLAASNSPNILQAIGEAATATLPELKLSKKERKAVKNDAVKTLMALEDVDRKTAIAGVEVGMDIYKTGLTADQAKRSLEFQQRELTSREEESRLNRITQKEIASLKPSNPSDLEIMMAIMQNGTPEQKAALKEVMELKKQQSGLVLPPDPTGNTGVDLSKWGQATVVPQ